MPVAAGQIARVGRRPYERRATDRQESDSATFTTTETVVQSVTGSLQTGRTYRVRWVGAFNSTVDDDVVLGQIREDSISGTVLQTGRCSVAVGGSSTGWHCYLEAYYTAVATGFKTFVATGDRVAGTGTCNRDASSQRPTILYVQYISG